MATPGTRAPRLPRDVRRRELLDATLDLIYEEGPRAVSVEAVARRAGVTRPVVYDHFGDLRGLLLALIEREERVALAPLLALMHDPPSQPADPGQMLVDGVTAFLEAVRANPRTWRLVLMTTYAQSLELRERFARSRRTIADRLAVLIEWGVAAGGAPEGLDHALAARLIVAAGEDAARLTLLHPDGYPPQRIAALVRRILALLPATARAPAPAREPDRRAWPTVPASTPPPAPGRVRMAQAQRTEQLLDVTLELLAEGGFEGLSIEAIARRAEVNRTVVYRSFDNLELLLLALERREDLRTRAMIDALLPADPGDRTMQELLTDALATFLGAVLSSPQTYRLVLQRPESAPLVLQKKVNRRRALVAERLRPLVELGARELASPAPEIDLDLVARLLLSVGEEMARLALDDPAFGPERLLTATWNLLGLIAAAPASQRPR